MIYLINFLIVPVYFFLISSFFGKKNGGRIFFIVVTLHAIIFRAIADPYVYSDTEGYALAFQNISEMSFSEAVLSVNPYTEWGPGYLALNWIIAQFTKDPAALFIVLSVLSVGGVMLFYYKTTETPLITVLFYLLYPMMYVMGFFVVRQHLSVVFVLWAVYYARNLKISIPLLLIGVSFHFTALIVLPSFFFQYFNLQKLSIWRVVLFVVIVFIVFKYTVGYVLQYTERYNSVYASTGEQSNIVPVILIGSIVLAFFLCGIHKKQLSDIDSQIVRFLIYGLAVALFGTTVPLAGRLSLFFIYAMPVGLSILFCNSQKKDKILGQIYTLGIFLFVILLLYISSGDVYRIYRTII